jgi:hypothetical protein
MQRIPAEDPMSSHLPDQDVVEADVNYLLHTAPRARLVVVAR